MAMLEVNDLNISFKTPDGIVKAVNGLNYKLEEKQTLGIVGESGAGKSQSAFALMGLMPKNAVISGSVRFDGEEILNQSEEELNKIRANKIGIIFQDPMTSLNPFLKVSEQMTEILTHHKGMSKKQALAESIQMLDAVKIPEAKSRVNMYPHEFSGGMRQRVMIAMSLLCKPKLLIADEPTTALDVTVQAQIMKLLRDLQHDFNTAIVLITHDLGVVAGVCDRTLVMYGGRVMEYGETQDVFKSPTHPYTKGLLSAVPRMDLDTDELNTIAGNPPNLLQLPSGCPFYERCGVAAAECQNKMPEMEFFGDNRQRACNKPVEVVA